MICKNLVGYQDKIIVVFFYNLGPLTVFDANKQHHVLLGIVSWGFPDIENRNASIYLTRVDAMMPWIKGWMELIAP